MTKLCNNIVNTVYGILINSKEKNHKFNVGYIYEVNTANIYQVVAILLKFNIDVSVNLEFDTSTITIYHTPSSKKENCIRNISCTDSELYNSFLCKYNSFIDSKDYKNDVKQVLYYLKFKNN